MDQGNESLPEPVLVEQIPPAPIGEKLMQNEAFKDAPSDIQTIKEKIEQGEDLSEAEQQQLQDFIQDKEGDQPSEISEDASEEDKELFKNEVKEAHDQMKNFDKMTEKDKESWKDTVKNILTHDFTKAASGLLLIWIISLFFMFLKIHVGEGKKG